MLSLECVSRHWPYTSRTSAQLDRGGRLPAVGKVAITSGAWDPHDGERLRGLMIIVSDSDGRATRLSIVCIGSEEGGVVV
jgi:hypothetical protein